MSTVRKMRKYPHLAGRVFGVPLMIEPRKLGAILNVLGPKLEIRAEDYGDGFMSDPAERKPYTVKDGVAIVSVIGTLMHRSTGLDALSGISTYQQIGADLQSAIDDSDVKSILLVVDSPGGEVSGAFDLASQVRASTKPVVSLAQDVAASAAYLIASAADQMFVTQSGLVGSIGVVLAHTDTTAADAASGVKVSYIHAGARKVDGSMPLDHEHRAGAAALQAEVDRYAGMFYAAVNASRPNLSIDAIKAMEAGVYVGQDAVNAGLADDVSTMNDALAYCAECADEPGGPEEEEDAAQEDGVKNRNACPAASNRPKGRVYPKAQVFNDVEGSMTFRRGDEPHGAEAELGMAEKTLAEQLAALKEQNAALMEQSLTLKAESAARDAQLKAVDDARKTEIIEKHMKRGAIVPSMMDSVKDLAAIKTAHDLDAALTKWPVILHNAASGTTASSTVPGVTSSETPRQKLDAIAAKKMESKPGISKAEAFGQACDENPGLYREHRLANPLGQRSAQAHKES